MYLQSLQRLLSVHSKPAGAMILLRTLNPAEKGSSERGGSVCEAPAATRAFVQHQTREPGAGSGTSSHITSARRRARRAKVLPLEHISTGPSSARWAVFLSFSSRGSSQVCVPSGTHTASQVGVRCASESAAPPIRCASESHAARAPLAWPAGPAPPQAGGQGATLGADAAWVASSLAPSVDNMVCKLAVLPTLPQAELLVGIVARRGGPRARSKHARQAIPGSSCQQSLGAARSAGGPHIFLQVGADWSKTCGRPLETSTDATRICGALPKPRGHLSVRKP